MYSYSRESSRRNSSRAHLVFTPTPSSAWRTARCTDGAAEGATFCCSFEPLTSTALAARPPCCPRHCVSLCVCVCVCLPVYVCFFMCLTLWLSCQSSVGCQWKFKTGLALPLTHKCTFDPGETLQHSEREAPFSACIALITVLLYSPGGEVKAE